MVTTVANAVTITVNPSPTAGTALEAIHGTITVPDAPQRQLGTDKEAIQAAILATFPDYPVMVDVARAESQLRPWVDNESGSSASGLFQILDGTWTGNGCTGNVYRAEDNIACARKIVNHSHGLRDWTASQDNW